MTDDQLDQLSTTAHESGWKACSDHVIKTGEVISGDVFTIPKPIDDSMLSQMEALGISRDPVTNEQKNEHDTFVSGFTDGIHAYVNQAN